MSSTITQSYASTFETTTMKLKIASQKPDPDEDVGGWTFLQALPELTEQKIEKENAYVSKRYNTSCRILSEKSLELCTENLGCETGSSDTMDDADILSLGNFRQKSSPSPKKSEQTAASRSFPPPLTSMSNGRSSLRIRPRREAGRLVITAVAAPENPPQCFTAERRDGRLTLTFTEYHDDGEIDSSVDEEMNESGLKSESAADEVASEEEDDYEESAEVDCDFFSDEDYHHHRIDEDDDDHDEESGAFRSEDLDANIFDPEVELGMEKFVRWIKSRCNDRPKGLMCNWEHFWVATS